MTRQELWEAMVNKTLVTIKGLTGYIQAIQMEDGSGYSFNVTLKRAEHRVIVLYVKCLKPTYRF